MQSSAELGNGVNETIVFIKIYCLFKPVHFEEGNIILVISFQIRFTSCVLYNSCKGHFSRDGDGGGRGVGSAGGSALRCLPAYGHRQMQLTPRERNCHGDNVNTCLGALINHVL